MLTKSLQRHFEDQTQERRIDPGVPPGIVPVAYILPPQVRDAYGTFAKAISSIGGTAAQLNDQSVDRVVTASYENRPLELWVHAGVRRGYRELYTEFCQTKLGVKFSDRYFESGFAVDHSFSRSAVPRGVDAYIRMFLVPAGPNSSWGGYFERQLKNSLIRRQKITFHNETVAIRAKLTGIRAPKKGCGDVRSLENIVDVVRQLLAAGMIAEREFPTDVATLAAFCGIADDLVSRMTLTINPDLSITVTPHFKVK